MTSTQWVHRRAPRSFAFLACLLAACGIAPAASIVYTHAHHADDAILELTSATAHDEADAFGQTAASLPGVGSSTSVLVGSDYALKFTATQALTGTDLSMSHTLVSGAFVPSIDTPFTFSGGYDLPAGATYVGFSAGFFDITDINNVTILVDYEYYGPVGGPVAFPLPAPAASTLLAGHTYSLFLEAAHETAASPAGPAASEATAHLEIRFGAVPLPSSAAAGAVALAILAARRLVARAR